MSKVLQRLLIFFVGLPVVIGLVWCSQFHHIALHILIFAASLLGTNEMYRLLSQKFSMQPLILVLLLSVATPFAAALCALLELNLSFINYTFIFSVMVCMAWEALASKDFTLSAAHLLSSSFIILYPGFFLTFISRMTTNAHSRECIALFLLMVCMCDSIAWLFGNLFGKNNKGLIKASPNKSIAGFIGGFAGTIFSGFVGYMLMPEVFSDSIGKILVLSFFVALVSIIGDLVESVIKRSVNIKDSGTIVPGRGGVLDSIDSIVFTAPVYYFGISFLL